MVPLPCAEAREQMVRKNLADRASANLNYEEVQSGRSGCHVGLMYSRELIKKVLFLVKLILSFCPKMSSHYCLPVCVCVL
jgi:hypothetical protein